MEFKNYEREYEFVYTGDEMVKRKCDLEQVSVFNNIPTGSVDEYTRIMRDTCRRHDEILFDTTVKYYWLSRRFCYMGKKRDKLMANGWKMENAFGVFMKNFVGYNNRVILEPTSMSSKLVGSYICDLFPNFDLGNPFEEKYEYPYKYMNLGCLFLVYQMEERFELLKYGEEKRMNFAEFSDYVLNYIKCFNDELGEEKYTYLYSNRVAPYIKNQFNKYGRKKAKTRRVRARS
jgi:hypothetical protein